MVVLDVCSQAEGRGDNFAADKSSCVRKRLSNNRNIVHRSEDIVVFRLATMSQGHLPRSYHQLYDLHYVLLSLESSRSFREPS